MMPGSSPRCHAVCRLQISNGSTDTIVLCEARGTILDPRSGTPLRSFPVVQLIADREMSSIRIPPGADIELTARTPMTVPPIDLRKYPLVRLRIEWGTSLENVYVVETDAVEPFVTH